MRFQEGDIVRRSKEYVKKYEHSPLMSNLDNPFENGKVIRIWTNFLNERVAKVEFEEITRDIGVKRLRLYRRNK